MPPRPAPLLRRIRWGNVARLLAVPALVLLVLAWPRLAPRDEPLPPAHAEPVAPGAAPTLEQPDREPLDRGGGAKQGARAKQSDQAKQSGPAKQSRRAKPGGRQKRRVRRKPGGPTQRRGPRERGRPRSERRRPSAAPAHTPARSPAPATAPPPSAPPVYRPAPVPAPAPQPARRADPADAEFPMP